MQSDAAKRVRRDPAAAIGKPELRGVEQRPNPIDLRPFATQQSKVSHPIRGGKLKVSRCEETGAVLLRRRQASERPKPTEPQLVSRLA